MNEIFKTENGTVIMLQDFSEEVARVKNQLKALKDLDQKYNDMIREAMEQYGVVKIETENLNVTYVQPTEKESFDSKAFKEDFPELYDEYVKMTPVKASLRVKVN